MSESTTPIPREDVQQLLRELERLMKSTLRDHALAAVAVAAAAGFIAGVVLARRR